ncbi:MAG TPA: TAXI family TRAP transporter solute-binding subunit, partial [Clostridia bacterium]|nr:TAXI family TRAP transporter solute-binding subunit [Clostridia bacterium]
MKRNGKLSRKLICVVLILMLVFTATACGGAAKTDSSDTQKAEVTYLTMGTGGTAGTWYPVGGVIAAAMSKSVTANVTAQTSAASLENIRLVGSG